MGLRQQVGMAFGLATVLYGYAAQATENPVLQEMAKTYCHQRDICTDQFTRTYNPTRNFAQETDTLVNQITSLRHVTYKREHGLDKSSFIRQQGDETIRIEGERVWISFMGHDNIPREIYHSDREVSWERNNKKTVSGKSTGGDEESLAMNQMTYTILRNVFEHERQYEMIWDQKPFAKPTESEKKNLALNKNGEFVFYGADWCKPCSHVVEYLMDNKVPFREEPGEGTLPWSKDTTDHNSTNALEIVGQIQRMYGIQK